MRLPNEQSALTVQVSDFELRDLGTSFGVTAAPEGRVDFAVLDGKVAVTKRSESPRPQEQIFVEGEAFSASAENSVRNKMPFEPERYQDIWPLTVGINELSNVIDFVVPGATNPLGDLTDDHKLFLIPEQLNCRLDRPVELSLIRPGQTWPQASVSPVKLPSRENIRSYLLVYQPQSSRFGKRISLSGSVEFERPILGVAATRSQLESTDEPFGLKTIDNGKLAYRYLEERDSERGELPADTISIDPSGHRLFFHLSVGAGKDHLRVLVQGD
ncbi:hypothetical protein [Rubripirellula reticaptiva]|uniref:hypothetical protein n=1 Tax=Rubripirellula reticaptiva TaxID=2528013 RepID=UPI0011B7E228|nr:hypothetical protein [Rubripirellula reticaptiva]